MATTRKAARQRVHQRIRKKVAGTAQRPRLAVHFSGKHVYAQVIDDDAGRTLAAASTTEPSLHGKDKTAANQAAKQSQNVPWRKNSSASFLIAAGSFITEK